jgi:branched-chain amino acid transport system permease protein
MLNTTTLRRVATAALVVILVLMPWYLDPFRVGQVTLVLVVALAVAGLSILTGFTHQVSVGHSAFFAVGAYVTAGLTTHQGLSTAVAVVAAVVLGGAVGFVVGLPALRISGLHLAIVTLILGAAAPSIIRRFESWTGGTQGIRTGVLTSPVSDSIASDQWRYYVVLVALLLVAAGAAWFARSASGRALTAVGDHEIAAASFGIRVSRAKLGAFTGSAAITALAGALFAVTEGFLSPTTSYVTTVGSIQLLTAMVIGGRSVLLGPLLGAAVTVLLPIRIGQESPEIANVIYGLILIGVLLFAPKGLTGMRVPRRMRRLVSTPRRRMAATS